MGTSTLYRAAALAVAGCFMVLAAAAAEEPVTLVEPTDASSEEVSPYDGWQIFFMAANLWPKLNESEDKIDKIINNGAGRLFPRWEEPITFKDWRDDFKLWEFQVGISREITPKLDLYWAVGAVYGYQSNEKRYFPVGIPLKVNVEFERSVLFTSFGADYYYNGKPELPEGAGASIWTRLRAAKPYLEFAVSYVDLKGRAEGKFDLPVHGELFHYQDKARYDLISLSPRFGMDVPVTKRDSMSIAVGPILFTSHENEFNNIVICTSYRHRF